MSHEDVEVFEVRCVAKADGSAAEAKKRFRKKCCICEMREVVEIVAEVIAESALGCVCGRTRSCTEVP